MGTEDVKQEPNKKGNTIGGIIFILVIIFVLESCFSDSDGYEVKKAVEAFEQTQIETLKRQGKHSSYKIDKVYFENKEEGGIAIVNVTLAIDTREVPQQFILEKIKGKWKITGHNP